MHTPRGDSKSQQVKRPACVWRRAAMSTVVWSLRARSDDCTALLYVNILMFPRYRFVPNRHVECHKVEDYTCFYNRSLWKCTLRIVQLVNTGARAAAAPRRRRALRPQGLYCHWVTAHMQPKYHRRKSMHNQLISDHGCKEMTMTPMCSLGL